MCRKVNIQVDKDHELSVYYFPAKQNNALLAAEPMFGCIPGLVKTNTNTINPANKA